VLTFEQGQIVGERLTVYANLAPSQKLGAAPGKRAKSIIRGQNNIESRRAYVNNTAVPLLEVNIHVTIYGRTTIVPAVRAYVTRRCLGIL
jgi:hypothetical protein